MKERRIIYILIAFEILLLIIVGIGIVMGVRQLIVDHTCNFFILIAGTLVEAYGLWQLISFFPNTLKALKKTEEEIENEIKK